MSEKKLLGKTVQIEGEGIGRIVDVTENCVGVLMEGEGCKVIYVKKEDLQEETGLWN